jgi:alanine racemase
MPNSWLEIDRDNLLHNLTRIRALAAPARLMPVVKANAYGAGAVAIARELAPLGVDAFAVATVTEAVELREQRFAGTLTVLTYFAADETDTIIRHELSPVVFTDESVAMLATTAERLRRPARVWIKVDTGLGRIGVPWADATEFVRCVAKQPSLRIEGLLSTMSENPERNPVQVSRLVAVRAALPGVVPLPLSLASTQGLLSLPDSRLDVVRPGLILLGVVPHPEKLDAELVRRLDARPVVTWKTRVAYVKSVARGEQVGYGVREPLASDARIATLAVGWADGYPQAAQGSAHALAGGRRCPVLAISANSTMLDVTAAGGVRVDDEAVLIGRQGSEEVRATELLPAGGTLYRLLAGIPRSAPRLVVGGPAGR